MAMKLGFLRQALRRRRHRSAKATTRVDMAEVERIAASVDEA